MRDGFLNKIWLNFFFLADQLLQYVKEGKTQG